MTTNKKGFAPLLIVAVVALVALLIGGGIVVTKLITKKAAVPVAKNASAPAAPADALQNLTVQTPSLDFSASPLGALDVSTFEVGPTFPGNAVTNLPLNTSIGYSGKVSIAVPAVEIPTPDLPTITPAPTTPSTGGSSSSSSSSSSTSSSSQSSPPAQAQVTASNCAQFSSIPSAQYCTAVGDPNGITLCQQCKAAGL